MTRWLVFGLSGQVGAALRALHLPADAELCAPTRTQQADAPGLRWLAGSLQQPPALDVAFDAVVSLGPLDAFSHWFQASALAPARVVALGSTSVHGKRDSPDPRERALVATLQRAEAGLARACAERGCALTLLRPTLIYGLGRDRNLSRIVALARRWRWLPLPWSAGGLRQPVHASDVAAAVLAALPPGRACPGVFDLPGGETLPFDQMLVRTLAAAAPGARLVRVPGPLFRAGVRGLRLAGRLGDAGEGVLARLDRDLAYDLAPVKMALGYAPRGFQPTADLFPE